MRPASTPRGCACSGGCAAERRRWTGSSATCSSTPRQHARAAPERSDRAALARVVFARAAPAPVRSAVRLEVGDLPAAAATRRW